MRHNVPLPVVVERLDETATYPTGTQFEITVHEEGDYAWTHTFLFDDRDAAVTFGMKHERDGDLVLRAEAFVPAALWVEHRAPSQIPMPASA